MGLLSKVFGRKEPSSASTPQPPAPSTPPDPSKDPNLIRVHDAYGRELFLTKQAWRDSVLIGHIKKVWNDPEALYSVIVQSLNDGFEQDMVEPAEHLASIDPDPERGVVVLANVYRVLHREKDSANTLHQFMAEHGESGLALTNLAKVLPNKEERQNTLWRGLELDPNQDNAVAWCEAIYREGGGREAGIQALRRMSAIPGSWRADLWLARLALESKNLREAEAHYKKALTNASTPPPADLLMQLSGDLGKAGYLEALLGWTRPHYSLEHHGLQVGNNLLKAYVDSGQLDQASELLQRLYGQNRPDWKPTLSFWDTEIAKARAAATPVEPEGQLSATLLMTEGPIWLPEGSPAVQLMTRPDPTPFSVAFLGGTAETGSSATAPVHQFTDGPGRLSRALPLFLAEHLFFGLGASVHTLSPWLLGAHPEFILSGVAWSDEEAAGHALQVKPPADYVVITHLKTAAEPWVVDLRLVQTQNHRCLHHETVQFQSCEPYPTLPRLAENLAIALASIRSTPRRSPAHYGVPSGPNFISYLVRLEQLLAVRCSALENVSANFLSGERDILDGSLHLCLAYPKSASLRILLLQTCLSMKRLRPDIAQEYLGKLEMLQREHPLPEREKAVAEAFLTSIRDMEEKKS